MKILYGLETGTIEDPNQCVLIDVPDNVTDEDLSDYLKGPWTPEEVDDIVGTKELTSMTRKETAAIRRRLIFNYQLEMKQREQLVDLLRLIENLLSK